MFFLAALLNWRSKHIDLSLCSTWLNVVSLSATLPNIKTILRRRFVFAGTTTGILFNVTFKKYLLVQVGYLRTCVLTHLRTYALAYLRTCESTCELVHSCILAHLREYLLNFTFRNSALGQVLAHLRTCAWTCALAYLRSYAFTYYYFGPSMVLYTWLIKKWLSLSHDHISILQPSFSCSLNVARSKETDNIINSIIVT